MLKFLHSTSIFFIIIFFSNFNYGFCNPREMWDKYHQQQEQKYVGEKPNFCRQGFYNDGKFVQFTVDEKAFFYGLTAGAIARIIFVLASCDKKFETFKSSVVRPGLAKSVLFWVPTVFVYNSVMGNKEKEGLREKLARIHAEEEGLFREDESTKK